MRWLLPLLLLLASPTLSESITTSNVLPDLSAFSTSGSTTSSAANGCSVGEYCTGNATAGGGTYTSSFSVPLTTAEVHQGFTLNSAVTVDSHPSNAVLATCTSLTQASDCRDIFRLTISLFDGLALAEKFEREIELDFSGLKNYTFADTVAANSFDALAGEFSLFGIDAGYHSGFFGPQFSAPTLTYTYQTIVEQQILDQIAQTTEIITASTAPPPPPPSTETAPPASQTAGPPPPATTTMETQAPEPPAPPAPPTIEPMSTQAPEQQQQQEEAAAAEVEAEIQAAEQEPATEVAAPAREREQPAEPRQTRQQKVKAAAQRIVKKIAPSQRYSAASQTTTMVVMNMLSGRIATGPVIKDTAAATFFAESTVLDGPSMAAPMMNYRLFGQANGAHDALVESQWGK